MASARAFCFTRRACVRSPLGNRLVLGLIFLSSMVLSPYSVVEMVLSFFLAVRAGSQPIFESGAGCFLLSQLGGDLPVREPLATFTRQGLFCGAFTFGGIRDDRFVRYHSLTMRANNLVFHHLSFRFFRTVFQISSSSG